MSSGSSQLRRVIRMAVIVLLACLSQSELPAVSGPSDEFHALPDGDADFVRKLLELQMFEVAAQYCERSSELKNDPDQEAQWECLLAECRRHQAWTLATDSRLETIRLAIQRLSDFRASHTPSLRHDIQLRLAQLELAGVAGQIQEHLQRTISVKSAEYSFVPDSSDDFALKAAEQGCDELESLLRQIDAARKDLDASDARIARDRIRVLNAEMLFTRSRLGVDSVPSKRLDESRKLAETVSKNAGDRAAKFRAKALLIEISMEVSSADSVELQLKSLADLAETTQEKIQVESLRIRALLRRGLPSDALEQSIRSDDLLFQSSAELNVLRLECLLHIYELLFALPDSRRSPAMKTGTADEFTTLLNRMLPKLSGPWNERCQRIATRFYRVREVGPELADAFDRVDVLRRQNQAGDAAALLLKIASELPPNQQKLRASVLLELGQLQVKQQNWKEAEAALQESSSLFVSVGQASDAAAADLLRIFSIGRQWNNNVTEPTSAGRPANANDDTPSIEQRYREALSAHLKSFASESTSRKALEWRAMLELDSNPLQAAADLIQSVETNLDPSKQRPFDANELLRLSMASEALLNLKTRSEALTTDAESRVESLLTVLRQHPRGQISVESITDESQAVFVCLLMALAVCDPHAEPEFWEQTASTARSVLGILSQSADQTEKRQNSSDIALAVPDTTSVPGSSLIRLRNSCQSLCHAMLIAANFRTLGDSKQIESSREAIIASVRSDRDRCIALLAQQLLSAEPTMPGNPQLAVFLSQLMTARGENRIDETTSTWIDHLQLLRRLCGHSNDWQPFIDRVNQLSQMNLTEAELARVAAILSPPDSPGVGNESLLRAETAFWKTVQRRIKRGDDLWLEASLRMADATFRTGDKAESLRILNVVNALFPEWGNEPRRQRAERLMKQIRGDQEPAP